MIRFLEKCAQIEHIVSEIYLEFAGNQENDAVLASIWKDMARDEEDHCQQLRLAARLPAEESFSTINGKCPEPEPLYVQAGMILEQVKQRQFSVLERLKTAVALEKEFRKIHASYALVFKATELRATFDRLARADADHLRELDTYLKQYKAKHRALAGKQQP